MNPPLVVPERRRRRPPVSCTICRRRKIKCNRELPCSNCLRSKNSVCEYVSISPPRCGRGTQEEETQSSEPESHPNRKVTHTNSWTRGLMVSPKDVRTVSTAGTVLHLPNGPSIPDGVGAFTPPTPGSHASSNRDIDVLKAKIKHLEEQLSAANQRASSSIPTTPRWDSMTDSSQIAGGIHIHREAPMAGLDLTVARTIYHKTRLFGQSHWMVGVGMFMDILDTVEPLLQDANSRALFDLQKCKLLGKFIKTRRSPAWPTIPTHNLPPKDLADTLVGIYLRTFEACTRVFHIPTFKRDYEALWAARAPPDMAFVIQLKLVLAIAAPMYDDEFSLRASAIHWIYEAQTYISEPDFKARLSLPHLQTIILHFMAREVVGVEGGLIWISVGGLIRTAVYMGLHRDPVNLPMRSNFVCEMRRRLWNTILELALTTCMAAGAPPLLSLDDFDTSPPGNLDDEDLASPDPIAKPLNQPSQMSIALALRSMFPVRLAISEMLNGIGRHATYEETIRLETELRRQYKGISKTMQAFDGDSASLPNKFQTQALDFQFRRSLLALHTAFFVPALTQERYAFSRRVVVDTATQIWAAARPRSGLVLSHLRDSVSDDYVRLAKNGHGTLRQIALSAVLLLAGELKAQIKEDDSLGPVVLRRDFLDILDDAIEWQWETIEAGEVNTKGFLFLKLVKAQISGFMEGLSRDQFAPRYVRAAEEAEERCLAFLESQVGLEQEDLRADLQGINEMSVNSFPDFMDFDFSMNYPMAFDLDMTDPKAWLGGID